MATPEVQEGIILKTSGKMFAETQGGFGLNNDDVYRTANGIVWLGRAGRQVAVVNGAGNVHQGAKGTRLDPDESDEIGMAATVVNSRRLAAELKSMGQPAVVMSAFGTMPGVEEVDIERARQLLADGIVVVFGGGTGKTRVTTDSGATLRARQLGFSKVLFGKDKAEGVHQGDPQILKGAPLYRSISIDAIIQQDLGVMDPQALQDGRTHGIDFLVFGGTHAKPWETILDDQHNMRFTLVGADPATPTEFWP